MSDELINQKKTFWVTGGFNLFLLDYLPGKPIKVDLNLTHAEHLNLSINGDEWSQIFYAVLNCPTFQEICEKKGEDVAVKSYNVFFEETIAELPMMQQFSDIHSKVLFFPEHIEKLKEEILLIIPQASENEIALKALDKMKKACDEALNKKMLLLFV